MINPEILSQSKYQTRIIPISFEGTDAKVILAGSPISSKGVLPMTAQLQESFLMMYQEIILSVRSSLTAL